jgi:hypothetical protein
MGISSYRNLVDHHWFEFVEDVREKTALTNAKVLSALADG